MHPGSDRRRAANLPRFASPVELDEATARQQADVVAFIMALCRAMLQQTYYAPDHPQVGRAIDEAHEALVAIADHRKAVGLLANAWRERASITIESAFAEPVPLTAIVHGITGQQYTEKLYDFCLRARVVDFVIRTSTEREEFARFLRAFLHHQASLEGSEGGEAIEVRFNERLVAEGIHHVAALTEDELVETRGVLPWRIRLALTRLGRDLRALPMLQDASDATIEELKVEVLRDILRPLTSEIFLLQLFANLDLIAATVPGRTQAALERELVEALTSARLRTLARALLHAMQADDEGALGELLGAEVAPDLRAMLERQLGQVGGRLADGPDAETEEELLRTLFEQGVLPLTRLPESLQIRLRVERWAQAYLADWRGFLGRLDSVTSGEVWSRHGESLAEALNWLLEEGHIVPAAYGLAALDRARRARPGAEAFVGQQERAARALELAHAEEVVGQLFEALPGAEGPARGLVVGSLAALSEASLGPLLGQLDVGDEQAMGLAIEVLGVVAERQPHALVEAAGTRRLSPEGTVRLHTILRDVPASAALGEVLARQSRHPRPLVRKSALETLAATLGAAAIPDLVRALEDVEEDVSLSALRQLRALGYDAPEHIEWLCEIASAEEVVLSEPMQGAAIRALACLGARDRGTDESTEDTLLDRFEACQRGGVLSLLPLRRSGPAPPSERILVALIDGLERLGTPTCLDALRAPPDALPDALRARAAAAAGRVASRLGTPGGS